MLPDTLKSECAYMYIYICNYNGTDKITNKL